MALKLEILLVKFVFSHRMGGVLTLSPDILERLDDKVEQFVVEIPEIGR